MGLDEKKMKEDLIPHLEHLAKILENYTEKECLKEFFTIFNTNRGFDYVLRKIVKFRQL